MVCKMPRAQRNVFGEDLFEFGGRGGSDGVGNKLTNNFFAVLSFQLWRTYSLAWPSSISSLFRSGSGAIGWADCRIRRSCSQFSEKKIVILACRGWRSAVTAVFFFLHPISTEEYCFVYTLLRLGF